MQPKTVVAIIIDRDATDELIAFFDNTPLDHTAYIVFSFLQPADQDRLQAILQRHSALLITDAVDKEELQLDKVYVLCADEHITITGTRITVSKHPLSRVSALNLFLGSLAKTKKYKIAVVLLAHDGASITGGLEQVKNKGGILVSDRLISGIRPDYLLQPSVMPPLLIRWTENKWLPVPVMAHADDVQEEHRQRLLSQLGKAIKAKREERHMSQEALAKLCGMQKASMSKLEAGKGNPTLLSLFRVTRALGIGMNELL